MPVGFLFGTDVSDLSIYADRVKAMSPTQVKRTIANHEALVASDRWLALDEGTRAQIEAKVAVLRESASPIVV